MTENKYLAETKFFDYNQSEIQKYAEHIWKQRNDMTEKLILLFERVRDDVRYNPYIFSAVPQTLKASYALIQAESYCIPKAVLLGAIARLWGVPARLCLFDVKNHISSPQLLAFLKSDIFTMHGCTEIYHQERWIKLTPAFNKSLCDKLALDVLDFDGSNDVVFQQFTPDGKKHMEYLKDHGHFDDVPLEFILAGVRKHYPHLALDIPQNNKSLEKDLSKIK